MLLKRSMTVLGAGCAGPLLGIVLARRGIDVTLHEGRADPRVRGRSGGRSINLALAARGLRALDAAGLRSAVEELLVPMRGRMLHEVDGSQTFMAYGRRPEEFIWAVARGALNECLLDAAERSGVRIRFGERCVEADFRTGTLQFDTGDGSRQELPFSPDSPLIATDGARSIVRRGMEEANLTQLREDVLDHGYKELTVPAAADGSYRMEREALHIWPRGGFMLIALPNTDGSFTATLFLARSGPSPSFATLDTAERVMAFFTAEFPDVTALMPDLAAQFLDNPAGSMSTLHVSRWHSDKGALLIGDAAHGIVPFHGQGMNCAFEDCTVLDGLLPDARDWNAAFTEFAARRPSDTEAIARMAVENYGEMRDTVRDPGFKLQKKLSLELEARHPTRFIPRYSMVSFHPEIPYSEAERRGAIQQRILVTALRGHADLSALDYAAIDAMIHSELEPLRAA